MVPRLSRLSLVLDASRQAFASELTASMKSATRESGITARIVFAGNADELRQVLLPVSGMGTDAAYIYGIESVDPGEVVAALLRARLPAMFEHRGYVDAGGLMSYWLDWDNQTQRSAAQIDKVFRGENPAQIPFELPTRSELIINARTAKSLGLTIPKTLLVRADEVIE